jgi:septal ring factor EnvC (AmiA/AmiB activator)
MGVTVLTWAADTGQTPAGLAADVAHLRSELRALQAEFFRFQADSLQRIIAGLETETARAQDRLRRVEREETRMRDEITAALIRATEPRSPAERQELETIAANREMRPGSDLVRLLEEKDALGRRIDELHQQIQTERRRSQAALEALARLQSDLNRAQ